MLSARLEECKFKLLLYYFFNNNKKCFLHIYSSLSICIVMREQKEAMIIDVSNHLSSTMHYVLYNLLCHCLHAVQIGADGTNTFA